MVKRERLALKTTIKVLLRMERLSEEKLQSLLLDTDCDKRAFISEEMKLHVIRDAMKLLRLELADPSSEREHNQEKELPLQFHKEKEEVIEQAQLVE